jgi:penicillin amidase
MNGADVLFRALRIPEKSDILYKETDPEIIKALEAFADGVNQYIKKDDLSFEFKVLAYKPDAWKAEHSINLVGYMAWDLSMAWSTELIMHQIHNKIGDEKFNELLVDLNYQKNVIYPDFQLQSDSSILGMLNDFEKVKEIVPEIFQGSNNWVVAGKKSTTGKPIFANDMHLGLMIPGVWSQIHQYVEGKIDVTGVILPGQPFVISGHNNNIAWGMTNVMLDDMDFYIETINEDTTKYKLNGEWKDLIIKKEQIKDKDGKMTEKTIRFTHRGPIISGIKNIKDKQISMHWIGNEMSNELRSVYLLNRAENWEQFRNAVSSFKAVSQNIAYADVNGNIGLQCCAGVPVRKTKGNQVFPGDTDEFDWQGIHPFEELPFTYNPECGYVYSANNRTIDDDYPYYISSWYDLPNRANRIKQMLTEKEKLSVEDFKKMHTDQHSVLVDDMLPVIFKSLEKSDLKENEKTALSLLQKWNHVLQADSPEPLIFEEFYKVLATNILKDDLGDSLYEQFLNTDLLTNYAIDKIFKTGSSILCDDINTKDKTETLDDMILLSFKDAVSELSAEYGNNLEKWKWGKAHKLALKHPLGKVKLLDIAFNLNRTYEIGGSYHTVSPYSYDFKEDFSANHGASHRHIYSLNNWNESFSIIPTGVSDIPSSDHYCDQSEMYVNGIYHEDLTNIPLVKEKAKYKAVFKANKK